MSSPEFFAFKVVKNYTDIIFLFIYNFLQLERRCIQKSVVFSFLFKERKKIKNLVYLPIPNNIDINNIRLKKKFPEFHLTLTWFTLNTKIHRETTTPSATFKTTTITRHTSLMKLLITI